MFSGRRELLRVCGHSRVLAAVGGRFCGAASPLLLVAGRGSVDGAAGSVGVSLRSAIPRPREAAAGEAVSGRWREWNWLGEGRGRWGYGGEACVRSKEPSSWLARRREKSDEGEGGRRPRLREKTVRWRGGLQRLPRVREKKKC